MKKEVGVKGRYSPETKRVVKTYHSLENVGSTQISIILQVSSNFSRGSPVGLNFVLSNDESRFCLHASDVCFYMHNLPA